MSSQSLLPRTVFDEDHVAFRESVRRFLELEIAPYHARWEEAGIVDREAWAAAGRQGLLCMTIPEQYGGLGVDRRYSAVLIEEIARQGLSGPFFHVHSDIVAPYIDSYGTEAQKSRWLPPMARGEIIAAIAMTEPGAGSDLQAMRTVAVRDGDEYVLNGQKTYISNGQLADLVVVAAKTDPAGGSRGVSLFLVERERVGFERGRNLKKMGSHAQDTSELFFSDVRIPMENRLGDEGHGFYMMMKELAWERMLVAIRAVAGAEQALVETAEYARNRMLFGKPLFDHQYNRFKLAELRAQTEMARVFIDRCIELVTRGELDAAVAAIAKKQSTDLMMRALDDCVQMHGGAGYMWEYPVCRAFVDGRYTRIAGGSNETMLELIARTF